MTDRYILAKIDNVKTKLCQKLFDGEMNVDELREAEKRLTSKNEPENYYQAEAIKQAIEWWDNLDEANSK